MITTSYAPAADARYVRVGPKGTAIAEARELEAGILLNVDEAGHLVGIRILSAPARRCRPYRLLQPDLT